MERAGYRTRDVAACAMALKRSEQRGASPMECLAHRCVTLVAAGILFLGSCGKDAVESPEMGAACDTCGQGVDPLLGARRAGGLLRIRLAPGRTNAPTLPPSMDTTSPASENAQVEGSEHAAEQADAADEAQGGTRTASGGAALCPRWHDGRGPGARG